MGGKIWTTNEDEYLKNNWGKDSIANIALKLGRSKQSINKRATKHELMLTKEQLEKTTGIIRWTKDMEEYLIENYGKIPSETLAKTLGVKDGNTVRKKASTLGICKQLHTWNEKDLEYLKDSWGDTCIKTIAQTIGTTEESVRQKGYLLGLRNQLHETGNFITMRHVSEITGVGLRTVYSWVDNKKLKCRLLKLKQASRYRITLDDLTEFLRENPKLYNTNKCDITTIKSMLCKYKIHTDGSITIGELPKWFKDKMESDSKIAYRTEPKYWTLREEKMLVDELNKGETIKNISIKFNRSEDSIRGKLRKLKQRKYNPYLDGVSWGINNNVKKSNNNKSMF